MKIAIFGIVASLMVSVSSFAYTPYGVKDCEASDAKVDVYVSRDRFEPRVIFVKEKDKVCLVVHAVDSGVALTIEGYPLVYVSALANSQPKMEYFRADKVGEFKIKCRGCAIDATPKLVVQSKAEFEKAEERTYQKKSLQYRKNDPKEFETRYGK